MSNAPADQNFIRARLGILNTDGVTTIPIAINEATGAMKVSTTATISFTMSPIAKRDENFNSVMLWRGQDGLTYPWVVTSAGEVLIDM